MLVKSLLKLKIKNKNSTPNTLEYHFGRLDICEIYIPILKKSLFRDKINKHTTNKWRCEMAVSYKKLFHLMIEKDISNVELQRRAGFSGNILTRLKRNSYVSLESIETICKVLDCKVDDILEFVPNGVHDGGKDND